MKPYCEYCGEEFNWDETTGDGEWCSWECQERTRLAEEAEDDN